MLETFFRTHSYLMEHFNAPVRRALMDGIDWSYACSNIRGLRITYPVGTSNADLTPYAYNRYIPEEM